MRIQRSSTVCIGGNRKWLLMMPLALLLLVTTNLFLVNAFTSPSQIAVTTRGITRQYRQQHYSSVTSSSNTDRNERKQQEVAVTKKKRVKVDKATLRKEGGLFSFNTKYGALNLYSIYYAFVSIAIGLYWFVALTTYQLFRVITFGKVDKQRLIANLITQLWGVATMRLTGMYPKMENVDILKKFYKEKRPALFVANHCSWQDIPCLGGTIGWRNYKIVAKKELRKVPILGKAIAVGGNVMVDRTNRRSQLETLKKGIQYLKDGVNLCTFPEGTRSRDGKLTKFKNGAFKMAHKAGAPVIPISIVGAQRIQPAHWIFPCRSAWGVGAKVIIHEPIESKGKTEEELAEAVRKAIIENLPPEQRPEDGQ